LAIAVAAFTFSNILTKRGQLLSRLNDKMERDLPEWIYMPLIGCQYCVSGQWSFWFYINFTLIEGSSPYIWWIHIWFTLQTIFVVGIVTTLHFKFLDNE